MLYVTRNHELSVTQNSSRNSGFICGELKLALTLRMLAGASYLDLLMQYGVSPAALYQCFWFNQYGQVYFT